ncbi:tetratricopeptide repeat protein [Leptolyngbya sp. NK1-12]|uniref:Tetratricopeptide repeat protein n=1 Tax=Leptolyngbya sp. NK1-12 TaxID=2547451 RepID=A0AA96WEM6_9CYAN|nr:tetratricopeptide repeat protein [Leptolyngbya sp. NK1-12]
MLRFAYRLRVPRFRYWKIGAAIGTVVFTGITTQVWLDQQIYRQGEQAYVASDCEGAMTQFDRILHGRRLIDLNEIVSRTKVKRSECAAFLVTMSEQKDALAALLGYEDFVNRYSASPLTKPVQQRAAQLFQQTDPAALAKPELCNELKLFETKQFIPQPEDRLPRLHYACGQTFAHQGDPTTAVRFYQQAEDYSHHPLRLKINLALANARLAEAGIDANQGNYASAIRRYRQFLADYPNHQLTATAEAALARVLVAEAGSNAKQKNYDTAIRQYKEFLQVYPNHSLVPEVKAALAKTMIAKADTTGTNAIAPPNPSGSTRGGVTEVVIQNASPEKIQIVFSGPEPRIEELPPCPSCKTYIGSGPTTCPEQGSVRTYTLKPGQYKVLVETSDPSIMPFKGNWALGNGTLYDSCFFIVATPSPLRGGSAVPVLPELAPI